MGNLMLSLPVIFFSSFAFDLLFFLVLVLYVYDEARMGLVVSSLNFFSIVTGYIFAVLFYATLSSSLSKQFSLSSGYSDVLAFLLVAFFVSFLLRLGLLYLQRLYKDLAMSTRVSFVGGGISGLVAFFFLSVIIVNLCLLLPFSEPFKKMIFTSYSGKFLLSYSSIVEQDIKTIFGQAIRDSLHFMTVKPQADEFISLKFKTTSRTVDQASERVMIALLNQERSMQKLKPLTSDKNLTLASRSHALDMAKRSYFSHYTPEKLSPFDRLQKRHIQYLFAGENLALAPTVEIAMQGLMRSPGHRANILSPSFSRVGIGVVDMGLYGKMYVQTFSD